MLDPFTYQDTGSDFLASRRRGLLLDDPGTGKTLQAIMAARKVGASHVDTLCPASVTNQWGSVYGENGDAGAEFDAFSYEKARDKGVPFRQFPPRILVIDEIHYLNNANAGRTVSVLGREKYGIDGLINRYDYVWGMSGTWMTRDPSVLYPVMHALIPGSLYSKKTNSTLGEWQFLRKFCKMWDTGRGMKVTGSLNLGELREMLTPYYIRRTKADVRLDWKEPVKAKLWLDAGKAANLIAKAELEPEGQAVAAAFKRGGFDALAELADTDRTGISRYRRYIGLLKVLPVVDWLLDEFDGGMEKIVIICVHREVIETLAEKLQKEEIAAFIYYGGMTAKQKDEAKFAFIRYKGKAVMVAQIDAAGTGVDELQKATGRMLFVEWSWVASHNDQALDRLDRIGQQDNVLGQFAAFEGSLDGAIMSVAARRGRDSLELFN
jgi:SWI/SNF-related matrix-associated actin-dependent regulator 1 of chromatin subfamily A